MANVARGDSGGLSLDQLKERLKEVEREYRHIEAEREELGREFDEHPEAWMGDEPAGLSGLAKVLDSLDAEKARLRRMISERE